MKNLVDGEIILVSIGTEKIMDEYVATISKIVGHKNNATTDIKAIYAKHNVPF